MALVTYCKQLKLDGLADGCRHPEELARRLEEAATWLRSLADESIGLWYHEKHGALLFSEMRFTAKRHGLDEALTWLDVKTLLGGTVDTLPKKNGKVEPNGAP